MHTISIIYSLPYTSISLCNDSDTLRRSDLTLSESKGEGHPPIDLSKQGKPVAECSSSKTKRKRHTELLDPVVIFFDTEPYLVTD
jgi:hypothetical protein